MKIIKCYISSFGKLHDVTFDFNDGINTIFAENGWGKSTLAYFIKSMFYGLKGDRKDSVAENEREKFSPWDASSQFGGYIEFVWGEKQYKIERFFGKKSSDDSLKLIDLKTGKEFADKKDLTSLGNRIFDIDEDGFFSTTYYSQNSIEVKSSGSVTAKYNSVFSDSDDARSFTDAIKCLEDSIRRYVIRGGKGEIADIKKEISDIEDRVYYIQKSETACNSLRESVVSLEKDIEKLSVKAKSLREKLDGAGKFEAIKVKQENFNYFSEQKRKLLLEKKDSQLVLNNNDVSLKDILFIEEKINHLNKLAEEIEAIEKACQTRSQEGVGNFSNSKLNFGSMVFLIVSALFAGLCGFLSEYIGFVPLIIFAVMFVVSMVLFFATRRKEIKSNISNDNNDSDVLAEKKKLFFETENIIKNFISKFNVDKSSNYVFSLGKIRLSYEHLKNVDLEILSIDQKINEMSSDPDLSVDISKIVVDNNLKIEFENLSQIIDEKKALLASTKERIARLESEICVLNELEERKDELIEKLSFAESRYSVLTKTQDFLRQADENLRSKYRLPLETAFNKYLKLISGHDICAEINVDMVVNILENGQRKDINYYSKGYQDLFNICKRFALIDVLFVKEKPFIVLDDPFYNFDEKKISLATDLIKKLSSEYQIIYLVCHESRKV